MTRALVIFAVLVVLGAVAAWALAAYTRRLDGKVDASQTPIPSEPATPAWKLRYVPYVPPAAPAPAEGLCGAQGPIGMRCDWPPHDGMRHGEDGLTWISNGGPVARPTHLGTAPFPQPPGGER